MRFVVLGDLHYSQYPTATYRALREEFFERLFTSVVNQQADVVLAIGDTTDNGLPEEFEGLHSLARRVGLRFITVNGNHDLLHLTKAEVSRYTGNQVPYFTLHYNPEVGLSHPGDVEASRFLIMDTPREKNAKNHGGLVGPKQLDWLGQQLDSAGPNPLFTFGHHPLKWATRWSALPMLNIDNSRDVQRIFQTRKAGAAFYFCGHNHTNSISRQGNWTFIQTASPLRTADFRVIDWTPQEVHLRTVAIEGGQATYRLGLKVGAAMKDFTPIPGRGFSWDREFRMNLAEQPARSRFAALSASRFSRSTTLES